MFVGQVPAIGHADVVWQGQRPGKRHGCPGRGYALPRLRIGPWIACEATSGDSGSSNPDKHLEKTRQQLNRLLGSSQSMTGTELRQLVFDKWGRSYDVRLQRRGKRMYLHVMWKHLEQQSFPLTEEEYDMQLQAVAEYLSMWGVADTVRTGIKGASKRGPGYTGGGSAKAVSIPLDVDVDGARSGEWNSFLS